MRFVASAPGPNKILLHPLQSTSTTNPKTSHTPLPPSPQPRVNESRQVGSCFGAQENLAMPSHSLCCVSGAQLNFGGVVGPLEDMVRLDGQAPATIVNSLSAVFA